MIVIEGFDPKMLVSANQRIHHHQRAKVCRYWREKTGALTHLAGASTGHDQLHITIHVRYPTNHRRDVGNLYPFVAKPLVDGLVDAGALDDDDDHHVLGPDLRRDYPNGPHRIRIHVTPADGLPQKN